MKNKAFILVGHSNWGKSETIYSLKDDDRKKQHVIIKKAWILVRSRSNDDIKHELLIMIKKIVKMDYKVIIILLCPRFDKKDTRNTLKILNELIKKYSLYFFVLEKKYGIDKTIRRTEIGKLKRYGRVKVLKGENERNIRAKEFKKYITENL